MNARIPAWAGSRTTYTWLLALNALALLAMGWKSWGGTGVDEFTYLALAKGILNGHYSQWLTFDPPIPDTFRTPGYPLYIACFTGLTTWWKPLMTVVQGAMYITGCYLVMRVNDRWGGGTLGRNIVLLLLLVSVNVTPWIFVVTPEIPVLFCMAVLLWVDVEHPRPGPWRALGIGLLLGFIFQCRPVYLLFPIARLVFSWWYQRRSLSWGTHAITLAVFGATLLPFAFWNKAHHGVFSVTPIEGGGGVFNLGYWCGRIPGYPKERAFENFISDEMVRFIPEERLAEERRAYETEWDGLEERIAPLLTARDSAMRDSVGGRPNISYTYNTRYTLERERRLKEITLKDIGEHPGYFVAFKAYSAVRLWVVGIDRSRFEQASTVGKAGMIGAFALTLSMFVAVIALPILAVRRRKLSLPTLYPAVLWVVYTGLIHIPFVIQTRYTSSVRPILYLLIAVSVSALLATPAKTASTSDKP